MNSSTPFVRKPARAGPALGARDRRVRRTQEALTRALVELVLAKRYDSVTIQNLLDRADVGRSTFCSHYLGKDDLLLKSFERMLELLDRILDRDDPAARPSASCSGTSARSAPSTRLSYEPEFDRQYHVGITHMSRTIEWRLAALPHALGAGTVAPKVKAQARGTLFALLRWWVDQDAPNTSEQMDAMLHAMAAKG